MTKREMIDEILSINLSAEPQFLARFADDQLFEYLAHLRVLSTPRLTGNAERYEKYFRNLPRIAEPRPKWRCDTRHVEEVSVDEQADHDEQADLACQATPATDAQPAPAAGEPVQEPPAPADAATAARDECPAPADALAVAQDESPAPAEQAPQTNLTAEPAQTNEAAEPAPQTVAAAEDARGRELVAQDVDLAVGQAEREQLLSAPADAADAQAEDDEADESNMEAPFKIAAPPRRRASTRATASTAAKQMLYGADTPQPPPHPRRRAKSRAQVAVTAAPQADQTGQDDLDDEKWPY